MQRLRLTQGDTRPPVYVQITSPAGPVDVSSEAVTVRLNFKREGSDDILQSIIGVKLAGTLEIDGVTEDLSRYPVAGSGGRVRFDFPIGSLDVDPGFYEGVVEVVSNDSSLTAYNRLDFVVKESV